MTGHFIFLLLLSLLFLDLLLGQVLGTRFFLAFDCTIGVLFVGVTLGAFLRSDHLPLHFKGALAQ